ncbi:hypothetical protein [Cryobacterium breve]|uniref:hypothetical protein n=1 Tax=Cryobacterium breve TaxID=1259258 RepID=UPI00248C6B30|nr:hypothetical protein [Cryobacterium breve]
MIGTVAASAGSATGPFLPPLNTRIDLFDMTVASTVDYLRSVWPDQLADVAFEVAAGPYSVIPGVGVERWAVHAAERRIVFYRLPIQRLTRLHRNDDLHRRMVIESLRLPRHRRTARQGSVGPRARSLPPLLTVPLLR